MSIGSRPHVRRPRTAFTPGRRAVLAAVCGLAAAAPSIASAEDGLLDGRRALEAPVELRTRPGLPALDVSFTPVRTAGTPAPPPGTIAGGCDTIIASHTDASFEGGSYVAQAGFAQSEIAAASYDLDPSVYPIQIRGTEMIFVTSGATVPTTTEWSVLVWEGTPATGTLLYEISSDGLIIPHIELPPGTNGVNVNLQIDPGDPEQLVIQGDGTGTFSIGYRIDMHNDQTQNPCFFGPPPTSNAFPTTDTSGLAEISRNWLRGVNCGPLGCPPNGGWASFQQLNVLCRPSGDWVMRASWESVDCFPGAGACCFADQTCTELTSTDCAKLGGQYQGDNVLCIASECPEDVGACCLDVDFCAQVDEAECVKFGGIWQGPGTVCPDFDCGTGACCFESTGGCLPFTPEQCDTAGGVFQGLGVLCDVVLCFPSGACCLADGTCVDDTDPDACAALGGNWQGDDTTCGGVSCPLPGGACCFGGGGCIPLTEGDCTTAGGTWAGAGTTCVDGDGSGTADACEQDACPEDLDDDGVVGFNDLVQLLTVWGDCAGCPEDLDGDGVAGFNDLVTLLTAWGDC